MTKLLPQQIINRCYECPQFSCGFDGIGSCGIGHFIIREAIDCYVYEEIDSRCPLEDYNG